MHRACSHCIHLWQIQVNTENWPSKGWQAPTVKPGDLSLQDPHTRRKLPTHVVLCPMHMHCGEAENSLGSPVCL